MGGGEGGKRREKRKRNEESFRERSSTFSLVFTVIGLAILGRARGKAHPRDKSFASRPESGSFEKLQEVGVFLLLGLVFG